MELADPAIYDASKYVQDITGKDPRPARKANEDLSAYQLLLNSCVGSTKAVYGNL